MSWSEYCGSAVMGGMFAGHGVFMIAILALTFFLGRLFFSRKEQKAESRGDTAFDLLRQRYASGEIDETEYVRRRANLT